MMKKGQDKNFGISVFNVSNKTNSNKKRKQQEKDRNRNRVKIE